jgi:hypothetical protein
MRELFIYYRVRPDAVERALAAAQAMQEQLRSQHPGLTARLLRRQPEQEPEPTLMEVYSYRREGEPPGVSRALEAQIAAAAIAALSPFVAGERHTEVFVPCAS